jgi:hypothetical protein
MARSGWQEVDETSPCPICNKPDWCSTITDGTQVMCRRKNNGSGIHKQDKSGTDYYLYRLDQTPRASMEGDESPSASDAPDQADAEFLNQVYGTMLDECPLSPTHRQELHRRGLTEGQIKRNRYGTLPHNDRDKLAAKLVERFGADVCAGVPGLYKKNPEHWSLAGAPGILAPVRDTEHRIVALKVRADDAGDGHSKYTYLSSKKHGGPGPGSQVHVALCDDPGQSAARLTEGELKADVATALTWVPTISIPGVSSWRMALPVFRELGYRTIRLAFDADAVKNEHVARALYDAFQALEKQGFEVLLETWPLEDGKGIDDLLVAGHKPTLKAGDEARKAVNRILAEAKGLSRVLKNTVTAEKLLNTEFPEIKWTVRDVLPEGLTILGGKPKIGKSWFALDIGVAVASGGIALGDKAVEQGAVLYLALEDNQRRLQSRLKKRLNGGRAPQGLELATQWPRLNEGGLEALEGWLISHPNARLIIIDTLAKMRKAGNSNDRKTLYDADYESVEPLLSLAGRYNVAVLVVHHLRKAGAEDPLDEVSGSTGLTGGVDGALVLKRERGRADAYLYVTGRDIENEQELALNWDNDTATWKIAGDAEEYRGSKERREIIECLRSLGGTAGPKEVSDALGKDYNAVKQLLYKMGNDGDVRNVGGGKYTVTDNLGNPDNRDGQSPDDETSHESSAGDAESSHEDTSTSKVNEVIEVTDQGVVTDNDVTPPLLTSPLELESLAEEMRAAEMVGIDLETTGLSPRNDRVRLISLSTEAGSWLVDCFEVDPRPLFPILARKKLVFHNAAFDLGFLFAMGFDLEKGGEVIDTMLTSQILEDTDQIEVKEAA